MTGQQIYWENSLGKITFHAKVKFHLDNSEEDLFSTMPLWDPALASGWSLAATSRIVMDDYWEYQFEAAPVADGFKLRLGIRNIRPQAVHLVYLAPLAIEPDNGCLELAPGTDQLEWVKPLGYQSASSAAVINIGSRQERGCFALHREMSDNYYPNIQPENGYYVLDWQALLSNGQNSLLCAAITSNQATTQGLLHAVSKQLVSFRMASLFDGYRLEPGQQLFSEWIYLTITTNPVNALETATRLWGENMQARKGPNIPAGWTPKLYFKNHLTTKNILQNLDYLKEHHTALPLSFITVDDGYQLAVGDWLETNNHSEELPELFTAIEQAGFNRAVWLAPFVCQSDSKLMRKHPDWLLKNSNGTPRVAGTNNHWRGRFYALDCTNPEFLKELTGWFTTLKNWKVDFFKIDLAYAAALPGRRYEQNTTGLQALRNALQLIRQLIGDAYLALGHIPFGAAVGLADAVRLGPTVDYFWQSPLQLLSTGSTSFPAAANSIQGTLNRWYLQGNIGHAIPSWAMAADSQANKLSPSQMRALYSSIAISGGLAIFSENMPPLPSNQLDFERLLPIHRQEVHPISLAEGGAPAIFTVSSPDAATRAIAFFNWSAEETTQNLPINLIRQNGQSGFHLFDPWDNTYYGIWDQNDLKAYHIPPFGCRIFIATAVSGEPQLIGVYPLLMSHLLPGINSSYNADRHEFIINLQGFSARTLTIWAVFPAWCQEKRVKTNGCQLLDTINRGPVEAFKILASEEEATIVVRCLK